MKLKYRINEVMDEVEMAFINGTNDLFIHLWPNLELDTYYFFGFKLKAVLNLSVSNNLIVTWSRIGGGGNDGKKIQ